MDSQLFNVILLGSAFMVLFTAFQATGMISVSIDYFEEKKYNTRLVNILSSKVCWKESKMKQLMEALFMEVVISGEIKNFTTVWFIIIYVNSSMAILYAFFALTNIFAPAIVSILRPAVSMLLGATTYL